MMIRKRAVILVLFGIFLVGSLSLVEASQAGTLATVTVNAAYDLSIEIEILNDAAPQGEDLSVFVELEKANLGDLSEEITVYLDYEIIKGNKVIESGFLQEVDVLDEMDVIVEIPVSPDLRGSHVLKIIASNPQSNSGEDEDRFRVRRFFGGNSFFSFLFGIGR